jgi:hypothetical protein
MRGRIGYIVALVAALVAAGPAASAGPVNDDFQNALPIATLPFSSAIDTSSATLQSGEPQPSCGSRNDDHTVWYDYTAPADGAIDVDTETSGYDTVLAVYTTIAPFGLSEVACNDQTIDDTSRVGVRVVAGQTYHVQVAGWNGDSGTLALHADVLIVAANDDRAAATQIGDIPFTDATSTVGATAEVGEPEPGCGYNVGATVWYRYTAPAPVRIYTDTFGSDFDTVVAVYREAAGGTLALAACDDDSSGLLSQAVFDAAAGSTYLVQVGGYDADAGSLTLHFGDQPTCANGAAENGPVSRPVNDTIEPRTDPARLFVHDVNCFVNGNTGL